MLSTSLLFRPVMLPVAASGLWISTVNASPRVSTTSGHRFFECQLKYFLGVSYSQPPIGKLRWRSALPVHVSASVTEIDATQFGAACGQLFALLGVFLVAGISADETVETK
jgi:carboxylesterase type B